MPSNDTRKRRLIRSTQLKLSNEIPYLIKDIIPKRALIAAYGKPKVGKSFWILDIAWHIAMGREYHGRPVTKGPVLYIPFEGYAHIRERLVTINQEKGMADDLWLMDSYHPPLSRAEALITVKEVKEDKAEPALVILDTLNRSIIGSENDPKDMGGYISAAQAIGAGLECSVLIVHHEGNKKGLRGHTSLSAAVDCQIYIERGVVGKDRVVVSQVELMKDGPEGEKMGDYLRIKSWVNRDDDGTERVIDSGVLEPVPDILMGGATAITKGKVGPILISLATKALNVARRMVKQNGSNELVFEKWRTECMALGVLSDAKRLDNRERSFKGALTELELKKKIVWTEGRTKFRLNKVTTGDADGEGEISVDR